MDQRQGIGGYGALVPAATFLPPGPATESIPPHVTPPSIGTS